MFPKTLAVLVFVDTHMLVRIAPNQSIINGIYDKRVQESVIVVPLGIVLEVLCGNDLVHLDDVLLCQVIEGIDTTPPLEEADESVVPFLTIHRLAVLSDFRSFLPDRRETKIYTS